VYVLQTVFLTASSSIKITSRRRQYRCDPLNYYGNIMKTP